MLEVKAHRQVLGPPPTNQLGPYLDNPRCTCGYSFGQDAELQQHIAAENSALTVELLLRLATPTVLFADPEFAEQCTAEELERWRRWRANSAVECKPNYFAQLVELLKEIRDGQRASSEVTRDRVL